MRSVIVTALVACSIGSPLTASACSYPEPPTLRSALEQSRAVLSFGLKVPSISEPSWGRAPTWPM